MGGNSRLEDIYKDKLVHHSHPFTTHTARVAELICSTHNISHYCNNNISLTLKMTYQYRYLYRAPFLSDVPLRPHLYFDFQLCSHGQMESADQVPTFGVADYCVFGGTLLMSLMIGAFYAFRGQHSNDEMLLGNRQLKVLPVSISVMVSFLSAILIIG